MNSNTLRVVPPPSALPCPPLSEVEKAQHEIALKRLCEQYPEHRRLVRELYQEILASFLEQAKIRTFLSILVSREVKLLLAKSVH